MSESTTAWRSSRRPGEESTLVDVLFDASERRARSTREEKEERTRSPSRRRMRFLNITLVHHDNTKTKRRTASSAYARARELVGNTSTSVRSYRAPHESRIESRVAAAHVDARRDDAE